MALVRWLSVLTAIAALVLVAVNRHRRGQVLMRQESQRSEATQAEIQAAEQSIRFKTNEALRSSKRNTIRHAWILLFVICIDVPFFERMPLHAYFHPWGELLTAIVSLMALLTFTGCLSILSLLRYKRDMDKMLGSLREGDSSGHEGLRS